MNALPTHHVRAARLAMSAATATCAAFITHVDGVLLAFYGGRPIDVMQNDEGDLIVLVDRGNEWATGRVTVGAMAEAKRTGSPIREWWHGSYHKSLNAAVDAMRQRASGRAASEVR